MSVLSMLVTVAVVLLVLAFVVYGLGRALGRREDQFPRSPHPRAALGEPAPGVARRVRTDARHGNPAPGVALRVRANTRAGLTCTRPGPARSKDCCTCFCGVGSVIFAVVPTTVRGGGDGDDDGDRPGACGGGCAPAGHPVGPSREELPHGQGRLPGVARHRSRDRRRRIGRRSSARQVAARRRSSTSCPGSTGRPPGRSRSTGCASTS